MITGLYGRCETVCLITLNRLKWSRAIELCSRSHADRVQRSRGKAAIRNQCPTRLFGNGHETLLSVLQIDVRTMDVVERYAADLLELYLYPAPGLQRVLEAFMDDLVLISASPVDPFQEAGNGAQAGSKNYQSIARDRETWLFSKKWGQIS